jgi:hypothetical protein
MHGSMNVKNNEYALSGTDFVAVWSLDSIVIGISNLAFLIYQK